MSHSPSDVRTPVYTTDDCAEPPDVRGRLETLVHSDTMDKTTALEVMALHHELQTQHVQRYHAMERELDALRHELAAGQQAHRTLEQMDTLSADVGLLKQQLGELCAKFAEATSSGRRR